MSLAPLLSPAFTSSLSGAGEAFFFPEQFPARAALSALADAAHAFDLDTDAVSLALSLGLDPSARLGVQDLVRAAEGLGLAPELARIPPAELAGMEQPVLAFVQGPALEITSVLVVTQCEGGYVATRDHARAMPRSTMGPLRVLAQDWAPDGLGWVMRLA